MSITKKVTDKIHACMLAGYDPKKIKMSFADYAVFRQELVETARFAKIEFPSTDQGLMDFGAYMGLPIEVLKDVEVTVE